MVSRAAGAHGAQYWCRAAWNGPLDCQGSLCSGSSRGHRPVGGWFEYAEKFLHAPMDRLDNILDYKVAEMNYLLGKESQPFGCPFIWPRCFAWDVEKLSASAKALGLAMKLMRPQPNPIKSAGQLPQAAGTWAGLRRSFQMQPAMRKRVVLLCEAVEKRTKTPLCLLSR